MYYQDISIQCHIDLNAQIEALNTSASLTFDLFSSTPWINSERYGQESRPPTHPGNLQKYRVS